MKQILLLIITFSLFSCNKKQDYLTDTSTQIDSVVKSFYNNGMFHGIVFVSRNDTILYNKNYGLANYDWKIPFANDTKVRLASLSKSFTAILILQLVEEGKISLSDKLIKYYPDLKIKGIEDITLNHLLTHSSGLSDYDFMIDPFREHKYNSYDLSDQLKLISNNKLRSTPGEKFHYCTLGYNLLNSIVEKVTSKPFEEVLKEKILIPAKMFKSGTDFQHTDKRASTLIQGLEGMLNAWEESSLTNKYELYSTVNDLYAYHKALSSNVLLSDSSLNILFSPHQKIDAENYYGYGWNISYLIDSTTNDTIKEIQHGGYSGYSGSMLYRDVENDICIIFLDNVFYSRYPELEKAIINILHNKPFDLAKESIFETVRYEIAKKGIDSGIALFMEIKDNDSIYYTSGWELDYLKLSFREQGLIEYFIKLQLAQFELYPIFEKFTKTQIKKMDFIIKHEPENGIMYACRGGLYYSLNDYNKAKQDFKLSLDKGIPDREVEYIKGLITKCE
jgi:CubicO group peptidase (beta-lactamase class C family)